jgi:hypothetical protein
MIKALLALGSAALLWWMTGSAAGQSPVIVTPQSKPAAVAAELAGAPEGARALVLTGFTFDFCSRDPLAVRTSMRGRNQVVSQVPSPWMHVGSKLLSERVSGMLAALRKRSVRLDAIFVELPGNASADRVSRGSYLEIEAIAKDPRYSTLRKNYPAISAARSAPVAPSYAEWQQVIRAEVRRQSLSACRSATSSLYPGVRVEEWAEAVESRDTLGLRPARTTVIGTSPPTTPAKQLVSRTPAATNKAIQEHARLALQRTEPISAPAIRAGPLAYRPNEWIQIFESSRTTPSIRQALFALEACAQRVMKDRHTLYTRPLRLADIEISQLDLRYRKAGTNGEQFALAMADCAQADYLRSSGVELAVVAAYTESQEYLGKCEAILRAACNRAPLQRPGWTLYSPVSAMPASGDGVWLATAWGIEGIVEMLSVLGERVPLELRSELRELLRREISRIVEDWARQTPWYVRSRTFQSNQWIEVSAGLVKGCLFLGDPELMDAYELGVRNLGSTLRRLGNDGGFLEGVTYASMTTGSLLSVLSDLRATGDDRLRSFAWQDNAWRWWMHMVMPGRQFVNCYDSRMSQIPAWAISNPLASAVQAAMASSDRGALPNIRALYPGRVDPSVPAVRYQWALASAASPTLSLDPSCHFESQQILCWRTGWQAPSAEQTEMALWIRGGSASDSHSHRDQGQVSVYNGDRILIMECGTPDYGSDDYESSYARASGHSTFQIGALEPRSRAVDIPITVAKLDRSSGDVSMNLQPAFPGAVQCSRQVRWFDAGLVRFSDRIVLPKPIVPGTPLIRFHTGSVSPLSCVPIDGGTKVSWKDASLVIRSGGATVVTEKEWPDAVRPPFVHRVIEIRAGVAASNFEVESELQFARSNVWRDQ